MSADRPPITDAVIVKGDAPIPGATGPIGGEPPVERIEAPPPDSEHAPPPPDDGGTIVRADDLGGAPPAETAAEAAARDDKGRFARKHTPSSQRVADIRSEIRAETAERERVRRERQAEETHLANLRAERQRLEAPAPKTFTKARPKYGDGSQWDTYEKYEAALEAWDTERDAWRESQTEDRVRRIADERAEQSLAAATERRINESFQDRLDTAREKYADYDEADKAAGDIVREIAGPTGDVFLTDAIRFTDHGDEIIYHFGKHPDELEAFLQLDRTNAMMIAVRQSEHPVALLSFLATHRDEAVRIARLDRPSALWALAKHESSLAGAQSGSPRVAPISKAAPPPGHRAGSRSAGAPRSAPVSPDQYVRDRLEERRKERLSRVGISA